MVACSNMLRGERLNITFYQAVFACLLVKSQCQDEIDGLTLLVQSVTLLWILLPVFNSMSLKRSETGQR